MVRHTSRKRINIYYMYGNTSCTTTFTLNKYRGGTGITTSLFIKPQTCL